jgi:lactate dehydrogenase-like 2-hydroxyacid dehydrogenase
MFIAMSPNYFTFRLMLMKVREKLKQMENVTLLPHIGGATVETHEGFEKLCVANIENVLARKEPLTLVNAGSI